MLERACRRTSAYTRRRVAASKIGGIVRLFTQEELLTEPCMDRDTRAERPALDSGTI
jgi:hypothetical protein